MANKTKILECTAKSPVICPSLNREVEPGEIIELPVEVIEKHNLIEGPYKEIKPKEEKEAKTKGGKK